MNEKEKLEKRIEEDVPKEARELLDAEHARLWKKVTDEPRLKAQKLREKKERRLIDKKKKEAFFGRKFT